MIKKEIKLATASRAKEFVKVVREFDVDAELLSQDGKYIVNAKSILGVFSLDLSQPLTLVIHDNPESKKDYDLVLKYFESGNKGED